MSERAESALLGMWLIHLLLYVFLVPPWQHYDEPTHMEYAELIVELGHIPALDEDVRWLRLGIAESMRDAGFFEHPQTQIPAPNLDDPALSLGFNERTHPPLYYVLVASVLSVADASTPTQRLYLGRLLSAALGVVLFYSCVQALRLSGFDHEVRSAILVALAFHPVLADTMSSVNNDALANLVAVWLFIAALLYLRRPGWRQALFGVCLVILGWQVKRTLVLYSAIVPAAWIMALPSRQRRWLAFATLLVGVGGILFIHRSSWRLPAWQLVGDPQSYGNAALPWRHTATAYTGTAVFEVTRPTNGPGMTLEQEIVPFLRNEVRGQIVTLAGWMRADHGPALAFTPAIQVNQTIVQDTVFVSTTWQYVVVATWVPTDTSYLAVRLSGPLAPGALQYDALSLIAGHVPGDAYLPDGNFERPLLAPGTPRISCAMPVLSDVFLTFQTYRLYPAVISHARVRTAC